MKTKILVLIVIAAVASAGLTYTLMKRSAAPIVASEHAGEEAHDHAAEAEADHEGGAENAHEGIDIPGLETATAVAGEGWSVISATGKVSVPPDRLVKISPRIAGKVVAANGTVGDTVGRGQVLAVISSVDLAEARAQYRQASARLKAAEADYAREVKISELGGSARPAEEARAETLSAQGDLADARSELAQAKSELAARESELAQCRSRLQRAKDLYSDQIVSRAEVETAEAEVKRDSAAVDAARAKVNQAQTRIEKASSKLELAREYQAREEKLYKSRGVDMRAVQAAQSAVTAARIDVQAAADRIRVLGADPKGSGETISVKSPIAGRIVSRTTNVGETASPESTLFTVANLGTVWIEADVYEKDLARLRRGQPVEIRVTAYPERVFSGKVDSVSDVLSAESRTAKVRCTVPNSGNLLRGEMFAKLSIVTAKNGGTVLVPKIAVLDDAGSRIVFTPCLECPEDIKAGTNACGAYDKLTVTTGPAHGDQIEVLSGLEPGTKVVTAGAYQLKTAMSSGQLEAGCTDH